MFSLVVIFWDNSSLKMVQTSGERVILLLSASTCLDGAESLGLVETCPASQRVFVSFSPVSLSSRETR